MSKMWTVIEEATTGSPRSNCYAAMLATMRLLSDELRQICSNFDAQSLYAQSLLARAEALSTKPAFFHTDADAAHALEEEVVQAQAYSRELSMQYAQWRKASEWVQRAYPRCELLGPPRDRLYRRFETLRKQQRSGREDAGTVEK